MEYHVEFDIEFRKNPHKGLFVALEGIDGSGKSTQAQKLKEALEKDGRRVLLKQPFEGKIGEFVRTILIGEIMIHPVALQYLIAANRQTQQKEIEEALENEIDVIIDRYVWSAVAYGILDVGKGNKEETLQWFLIAQSILSMYHQFLMPNSTFYLSVSSEIAIERVNSMNKKKEIYEEDEKIIQTLEIYEWLVNKFPEEITVVDGEKSIEKVQKDIIEKIKNKI